jgi:hypothetical protein
MKTIAWLAGIGTLVSGVIYMVISFNRWEWNRALFFGLVVLIAEVGLATGLVLRRLPPRGSSVVDPELVEILRVSRPEPPDRFAWLRESVRHGNVFITFLVGGGVIVSTMAWLIDRLGARTAGRAGDHRLARRLAPISYPDGGLLVDDVTALAQEVPGADDAQLRALLRRAGHARG